VYTSIAGKSKIFWTCDGFCWAFERKRESGEVGGGRSHGNMGIVPQIVKRLELLNVGSPSSSSSSFTDFTLVALPPLSLFFTSSLSSFSLSNPAV
jgi:hypothetical protein